MRVARPIVLEPDQKDALESRARSASARNVERARIVLLASRGLQDQQIAAELKIRRRRWHAGASGSWMMV
jgi:hypothetical protein